MKSGAGVPLAEMHFKNVLSVVHGCKTVPDHRYTITEKN